MHIHQKKYVFPIGFPTGKFMLINCLFFFLLKIWYKTDTMGEKININADLNT